MLMLPGRTLFAAAERRQIGPKNPWFFRSLLLLAIFLVAAWALFLALTGRWR